MFVVLVVIFLCFSLSLLTHKIKKSGFMLPQMLYYDNEFFMTH